MAEDKTAIFKSGTAPRIGVVVCGAGASNKRYEYVGRFRIGRDSVNDLVLQDAVVSRIHAEVFWVDGKWIIADLNSANGTLINGQRITRHVIEHNTVVKLGATGPVLQLQITQAPQIEQTLAEKLDLEHYKSHYFGAPEDPAAGLHTQMLRKAFAEIEKKRRRHYSGVIVLVTLVAAAGVAYGIIKHRAAARQRHLAEAIFYNMKNLELQLAEVIQAAQISRNAQLKNQVETFRSRQKTLEESYNQFLDTLQVYGKGISETDRLILKVARIFGECEIGMPPDFANEVKRYIAKWKGSQRLKKAVRRAMENGYIERIVQIMKDHDLPPQFFYLALQESGFNIDACGPKTRFGIAKGIWQFIPATADQYGLHPGPWVDQRRPDPKDERHDFGRSTMAAARYLHDIYATNAQASGLLVMASYNLGERRVVKLIRSLPENPKDRNFWQMLKKYRHQIPRQTYDYVFFIFSAAVIGENPRHFGFDFDNPLALRKPA